MTSLDFGTAEGSADRELVGPVGAWLELMAERTASDLLLSTGTTPRLRIQSEFTEVEGTEPLSESEVRAIAFGLLTDDERTRFERDRELDFSFGLSGVGRFRGNLYRQRGSPALALRRLAFEIPELDELGVPAVAQELVDLSQGMVLVTGPTGSGKSTTMAAFIDRINREHQRHIVTVEDPIEYLHSHKRSVVDQREVGTDTGSFAEALRRVLRQAPDVVLLGEMRDLETISAALTVAETGHLTFGTLHTNSAAEAVNRMIDVFPPGQQAQVRTQLSLTLKLVLTQQLLPRKDGDGHVLATEIMVATPGIQQAIRDDKAHQIPSMLQTGRQQGMQTMTHALGELYREGKISQEVALAHAPDREELRRQISS